MTSLTAPMRTMNKRPSTQRKKPSRLSLSVLNGLHDGWLSLTGKWRLYFGKRCDSGVKDDLTAVPIDYLAKFRAGFAAAGGAEFDDIAKLPAFLRWLDAVHLPILPFADVQMVAVKVSDFQD